MALYSRDAPIIGR